MKKERSYGIIPLRIHEKDWEVLIVQHYSGYWTFPKGHAEEGETPQETATRELQEETGLKIERFLSVDPLIENYFFTYQKQRIFKTVQYFPALVYGTIVLQEEEVKASKWLKLFEAHEKITFKEGKHICLQTIEFLKTLEKYG